MKTIEVYNPFCIRICSGITFIGLQAVSGCIACSKCQETGYCCMDDKVNELLKKLPSIDGVVIGSPVYYGSAAGQLTAFLDRAFQAGFWKSR
ncbi:flavodoxin family protein [Anaerovorax odorimutans]|uniref:Flavodoxin family protein n=1 Tax=Anaerovorax odorimutans TaxID=109327 RepID=A0ABT1RQA6_9FIRM|nr:flavodoxin family protein [Anaerovorax odorimutans]